MTGALEEDLFGRVAGILDATRSHVVRAIHQGMVNAYWLIGREIVKEIQKGSARAEYGAKVLEVLSAQLQAKYGAGYSVSNLRNFRQFYEIYPDRKIRYPLGSEFALRPMREAAAGDSGTEIGFADGLTWSHYRALMRVREPNVRAYYEREATNSQWDRRTLERQIHSQVYERMLSSQHREIPPQEGVVAIDPSSAVDTLKNPYVLEFLDLPDATPLHEERLESAIIDHLQAFLLELGKGFAFVARQKRLRFEDQDLYVDLVFYNCSLKCYVLIDLKMGELTHRDVGQMDGYVRLFDDLHVAPDDNPTIGLILCAEKNDAVARYSVLADRKQIFASKYLLYLPTEAELAEEIARERRLIEENWIEDDPALEIAE